MVVPLDGNLPRHTTLTLLIRAQYLIKVMCYFSAVHTAWTLVVRSWQVCHSNFLSPVRDKITPRN